MKKFEAIIEPFKLDDLKEGLTELGITGYPRSQQPNGCNLCFLFSDLDGLDITEHGAHAYNDFQTLNQTLQIPPAKAAAS